MPIPHRLQNVAIQELSAIVLPRRTYPGAAGKEGKSFMVPRFSPTLARFQISPTAVTDIQYTPLRRSDGRPATGISNKLARDDSPWPIDCNGPM